MQHIASWVAGTWDSLRRHKNWGSFELANGRKCEKGNSLNQILLFNVLSFLKKGDLWNWDSSESCEKQFLSFPSLHGRHQWTSILGRWSTGSRWKHCSKCLLYLCNYLCFQHEALILWVLLPLNNTADAGGRWCLSLSLGRSLLSLHLAGVLGAAVVEWRSNCNIILGRQRWRWMQSHQSLQLQILMSGLLFLLYHASNTRRKCLVWSNLCSSLLGRHGWKVYMPLAINWWKGFFSRQQYVYFIKDPPGTTFSL